MFKRIILFLLLSMSLVACSASTSFSKIDWHYGIGSNVDEIVTTKVEFYRDGKFVGGSRIGGVAPGVSVDSINKKRYYWAGGGGLPVEGVPVPDHARVEIVSLYDRKRYLISVDLPDDLAQQMQQRYQVGERIEQRKWLYFGLAPGGYYEVSLFGDIKGVSPDVVLKRGIAKEVTDNWYDKKFPIGVSQYTVTLQNFDKEYAELFRRYPVPSGMEWAPIMDAYRAKQPKTDRHPIN